LLLGQVSRVFGAKKENPGAKKAAAELGIGLASFYNYANGTTLPDMDVLRKATQQWGIKWEYFDSGELLRTKKVETVEQLVFAFLDEVKPQDFKVVKVGPKAADLLHVTLQIKFSA